MKPRRTPAAVQDIALVAFAATDAWINVEGGDLLGISVVALASFSLLLRRRWPLLVFALTAPAVLFSDAMIATLIALYIVSANYRSRMLLLSCGAIFAACYSIPWQLADLADLADLDIAVAVGYNLALASVPAFLGQLVQARHDLSLRLREISEGREHERILIAQTALAKERAQLAREMHDVVSHQVSLIAVRAGALQVSTRDADTVEAATTIRQLSVSTLDELRHMVTVLRASGSLPTELTPQPTLAEIRRLVSGSGIAVHLEIEPIPDLSPPFQRTIYRTVQEALTNVRKHAPGASAGVRIWFEAGHIRATITNTAPTRPVVPLPSSHHGLLGLQERAELLDGAVDATPTPDGGYRLDLTLPAERYNPPSADR